MNIPFELARGQAAAEHFRLHQPDWTAVRPALERYGLRSRVLAAALRLLAVNIELDTQSTDSTHEPLRAVIRPDNIHGRLRAVIRAAARLAEWVRWYAFAELRHGRRGVPSNTELHRYLARLDQYASLLLSDRRPEGVAGLARLSLGLVHHLVSGTGLPA
jgi:hypothetical protein